MFATGVRASLRAPLAEQSECGQPPL